MVVQIIKRPVQPKVCMAQGGSRFMLPRTKKLDRSRASDRSYAYARAARGRSAYFRNHLTSERRAYFRLAGQLSQLCAQTLHIFAYYPRTRRARERRDRLDLLGAGVCARPAPRHKMCAAKPNICERPYRIYTRARQLIANTDRPRRHYRPERPQRDRYVCRARTRTAHGHKSLPSLGQGGQG